MVEHQVPVNGVHERVTPGKKLELHSIKYIK
jgi:hypothetical protein